MSSDPQPSSSSSSEMTKPNCTIRIRQDELLDDLADGRFATRSEALRTAIEELHQTTRDDQDTVYDQLIIQIEEVRRTVQKIQDRLDEIEQPTQENPTQTQQPSRDANSANVSTGVASASPGGSSDVENAVYQQLLETSPQTVTELAVGVDATELAVREALESLKERDFIAHSSEEMGQPAYRAKGVNE